MFTKARIIQALILLVLFIISVALFSGFGDGGSVEEGMPAGYQPNP